MLLKIYKQYTPQIVSLIYSHIQKLYSYNYGHRKLLRLNECQ